MNLQAVNSIDAADTATRWSLAPHVPAPKDARRLLVAIAATDDGRVGGSFEEAGAFLLFEKHGRDTCFIGRQSCPLVAHNDRTRRTRLFADCDMVVCADISETCRQSLSALGVACALAVAGARVDEAVSTL